MPSDHYPGGYSYSKFDEHISKEQLALVATTFAQHLASSSDNNDAGIPEMDRISTTSILSEDSLPPLVDHFDTLEIHENSNMALYLCDEDLAPDGPNESITQPLAAANERSLAIDSPTLATVSKPRDTSSQCRSYQSRHSKNCVRNLTNRHVALIQRMRHGQNLTMEHITDHLVNEFPDLRAGPGVDEEKREVEVRAIVELQCSIWAPQYIFGPDSVEEFIEY